MKDKNIKQKKSFMNRKIIKVLFAVILTVCIVIVAISIINGSNKETLTYRETTVSYGSLTVGVTESGTIEIGTVEQTFDLDMSALQRVTTTNSNSSSGSANSFGSGMNSMGGSGYGGNSGTNSGNNTNNMFGQMFNIGSSSNISTTSSNSNLKVENVNVSVGQEISEGDVILSLESEGVEELKTELENNVSKASADLEALIADQKLSTITAEYTLQCAQSYGDYALSEKNSTINSLKQDITDANAALEEAQKSLSRYQEQLAVAQVDYQNAVKTMDNTVWCRDNTDKYDNTYLYTLYFEDAQNAISMVESLKSKIEQLESKIESAKTTVDKCKTNISKAKRAYDTGVLSAEENYELRMLAYNTAQETYDITISYLEDDLTEQQENYDDTLSKWNDFNSHIDGLNILSKYNGVVTSISLEEGDTLNTRSVVVTLYDADDVTVTVTVDESDMTDIELNGKANVNLTAYPNETFEAYVSDISDASTDSSGNTTYDVTVTVKGDLSKLFQGMTAEVTFITKQVADVIYVSNRAIIRDHGLTYVKVKNEDGNIEKIRIETGFSDGINVEVIDGLTEGQIVLIEKGES